MHLHKKFLKIVLLLPIILTSSCSVYHGPKLDTVAKVDVNEYTGTWYEIKSFPNSFQKGCHCTTAKYAKNPSESYIRITNSCRRGSSTGRISVANGKAFIVPKSNNSKLKVQFFWPFRGNYWILALGDPNKKYEYALIGNPRRNYLWILSRTPTLPSSTIKKIEAIATEKLFDVKKLRSTDQSCYIKKVAK